MTKSEAWDIVSGYVSDGGEDADILVNTIFFLMKDQKKHENQLVNTLSEPLAKLNGLKADVESLTDRVQSIETEMEDKE